MSWFNRQVRAIRRQLPKMATMKTLFLASLSIMATCFGYFLNRLSAIMTGKPTPALLQDWIEWVFYFLLGIVIVLPLLHVLLSIKSENDRRTVLDDRTASADAIRFRRRTDTVVVESAETVAITWDMELESDADVPYTHIEFPMEFEIGRGENYRDKIKLVDLTVDGESVAGRTDLQFRQLRTDLDKDPTTPSMVYATVRIPVNLGKGDERSRVVLAVETFRAFPKLLDRAGDSLMAKIPFLTRELIVEIRAGETFGRTHTIQLIPGPSSRKVADAESYYLRSLDTAETQRVVGDGVQETSPTPRIVLDYPKTGYQYTVYFNACPHAAPAEQPPPEHD